MVDMGVGQQNLFDIDLLFPGRIQDVGTKCAAIIPSLTSLSEDHFPPFSGHGFSFRFNYYHNIVSVSTIFFYRPEIVAPPDLYRLGGSSVKLPGIIPCTCNLTAPRGSRALRPTN